MRVVYLGTGEIGLPALEFLARSPKVDLVGVLTQPDRTAGRGKKLQSPPVKQWACAQGLSVMQPDSVNATGTLERLAAWKPGLIVVCAYGQILKRPVLEMPERGCINIHASLLPRHRGASCIQAALLEGDSETGVTIIQMDSGLDTGDCLTRESLRIGRDETALSLHDRLAEIAPLALERALDSLLEETLNARPQDGAQASYAPRLSRCDGELDWKLPASLLERRVRAFYPWPGSYTFFRNSRGERKRIKILPPVEISPLVSRPVRWGGVRMDEEGAVRVAVADGEIILDQVQPEGGKVMSAGDWMRGAGGEAGQVLGSPPGAV